MSIHTATAIHIATVMGMNAAMHTVKAMSIYMIMHTGMTMKGAAAGMTTTTIMRDIITLTRCLQAGGARRSIHLPESR